MTYESGLTGSNYFTQKSDVFHIEGLHSPKYTHRLICNFIWMSLLSTKLNCTSILTVNGAMSSKHIYLDRKMFSM